MDGRRSESTRYVSEENRHTRDSKVRAEAKQADSRRSTVCTEAKQAHSRRSNVHTETEQADSRRSNVRMEARRLDSRRSESPPSARRTEDRRSRVRRQANTANSHPSTTRVEVSTLDRPLSMSGVETRCSDSRRTEHLSKRKFLEAHHPDARVHFSCGDNHRRFEARVESRSSQTRRLEESIGKLEEQNIIEWKTDDRREEAEYGESTYQYITSALSFFKVSNKDRIEAPFGMTIEETTVRIFVLFCFAE